jgi:hypothetical protein
MQAPRAWASAAPLALYVVDGVVRAAWIEQPGQFEVFGRVRAGASAHLIPHRRRKRPAMSSKPAKAAKPAAKIPGISDRKTLRERGATSKTGRSPTATAPTARSLLNDALATEYVCVLRYYRHYFMAKGMLADAVKAEFLEHARQEQAHAGKLAERIVQLGGEPDLQSRIR